MPIKQFSSLLSYLRDNNVKSTYFVKNNKRTCIVKTEIQNLLLKFTAVNDFDDNFDIEFVHAIFDQEACKIFAYKNEYSNVINLSGSAISKDAIKNIIIDSFVK